MKSLAVLLGTLACFSLASITAYGQINVPGVGGGGNRGDNKTNVQGNKDNKDDNKPDNNNRRGSNNKNNAGNKNDNKNDNNKDRGSANKNDNDNKDRGAANNNKNDNKKRDGVNIGGRDGINIDAGKGGIVVDSQRNKDRDNDRRDGDRRDNDRRRDDLTKRARIGDGDWDKFGIGRLDDSRYRNQSGNQWRYKRYGNDWFYWAPAGYWMFYGNNRWNRYDPDVYATYYYGPGGYVPQQQVVPANFNGPYYEDSNGFYYMNGNQRVYDPSIRRMVTATGP